MKFVLEKEYTDAERDAAGVGGQQKPHTIAQAIVQLEHCRDVAHARGEASAAPTAAGVVDAPATSAAAPAAAAPAVASPPAPTLATAAAAGAAVLQARLAAAIREEQTHAAAAASRRREVTTLRDELQHFAMQAATDAAMPLQRRAPAALPAGAKRPRELR